MTNVPVQLQLSSNETIGASSEEAESVIRDRLWTDRRIRRQPAVAVTQAGVRINDRAKLL